MAPNDDRQRYHSAYHKQRPRLPTPDNSLGSSDEQEFKHINGVRQSNSALGVLPKDIEDQTASPADLSTPKRNTSNHPSAASNHSTFDPSRLSLPPINTILGSSLSSPPSTPRTFSTILQASPCEPSYANVTYKPPSLYPHKKQKTDLLIRFASPSTSIVSLVSGTNFGGNRYSYGTATPVLSTDVSRSYRSSSVREPVSPTSIRTSSPVPHHSAQEYGHVLHYLQRTPDTTPPASATFPYNRPLTAEPYRSDLHGRHAYSVDNGYYRRPSTESTTSYHSSSFEHGVPRHHSRQMAHPLSIREYTSRRDSLYEPSGDQTPPEFTTTTYRPGQPSMFMPSAYEHQHGKARKRSNLPKQSTDIMKTWFDQNISNPYPSEEQKTLFSNATGISMTQVSNWFINHRRRCPELRDKREKGYGGL